MDNDLDLETRIELLSIELQVYADELDEIEKNIDALQQKYEQGYERPSK